MSTLADVTAAELIESIYACCVCRAPYVPRTRAQVTCGAAECQARRHESVRDPIARALTHRRATRKYSIAHRGYKSHDPWLWAAPPYGSHLPGVACAIYADRSISLRHARWLHAVITNLIDEPHDPNFAAFALIAASTTSGWGVWIRDEARARALANTIHRVRVGNHSTDLQFGHVARLRAPDYKAVKRGRGTVRIDAITPVSIRNNGRECAYVREYVSAENFVSTLSGCLGPRIGLGTIDRESLRVELVESRTERATVDAGSHWRPIRGWTGHVVVKANAPARWLLKCAEQVGLGGRTAIGFGRIRCTPLT